MLRMRYRPAPAAVATVNPSDGVSETITNAMSRVWEKSAIPKTSTAARKALNRDGRPRSEGISSRGRSCGAGFLSFKNSQRVINARHPGITANQKIVRIATVETSTSAIAGPAIAPSVSPARWNPNALPRSFFSTELAMIASRAGARIPLPIQPVILPARTNSHEAAAAINAGKIAVAMDPARANSRRLPNLSAKYPENSFTKLDAPSLSPSITPRAYTGAPRMIKNEGRSTVTVSYPRSPKKLARPAPRTVLFNHGGHFIRSGYLWNTR